MQKCEIKHEIIAVRVPQEKLSANKHIGQIEVIQYKFLREQYLFLSPGTLNQIEALLVLGTGSFYSSFRILALLFMSFTRKFRVLVRWTFAILIRMETTRSGTEILGRFHGLAYMVWTRGKGIWKEILSAWGQHLKVVDLSRIILHGSCDM